MIAITMISSISVYPRRRLLGRAPANSTLSRAFHRVPAPCSSCKHRKHFARPSCVDFGSSCMLRLPQSYGAGHRIHGDAAQELDLLAVRRLRHLHALHQDLQRLRISLRPQLDVDLPRQRRVLISVDRLANLAQRVAQLALLIALHFVAPPAAPPSTSAEP